MRTLTVIILFSLFPHILQAQGLSGKDRYIAAETAYRDGRIREAVSLLQDGEGEYDESLRPNVCRLYALCHLALDDTEKTEKYVRMLLKYMPYYAISLDDPIRFVDMVKKYRISQSTVVTASQQLETLEEVPVPVTLITEEMIRAIGSNNLKEVLTTYVPGITAVEGNSELNLAMHGVYSSVQQKILIMLNGHRLNSRATNAQAPDYSISLDKVKQIEVLRGPASSLYGNAALTAVVNIITKNGHDVDGISVRTGIGSFGTYKADLLAGKSGANMNFLSWASVYSSEGEKIHYTESSTGVWRYYPLNGNIYINGFNRKPVYDIGCITQWDGHWKLYFNIQHAKMQPVYSYVAVKAPYSYEKYRRINGEKPGNSRTTLRGELQYNRQWSKWSLDATLYADMERQMNYEADGDSLPDGFFIIPPEDEVLDSLAAKRGFFQMVGWNDYAYGINVKSGRSYSVGNAGHGNLLAGCQLENYTMLSSDAHVGDNYDRIAVTLSEHNSQIRSGNELSFSAFAQIKHYLTSRFIANIGLRYDYKRRFNGKKLHAFSPRAAFIYKTGRLSLKACYARSFVDAPYFNRASTVASYRGSENLAPEYMDAIQLCATWLIPSSHLEYDCNLYYNSLDGLIYYDRAAASGHENDPVYSNAGSLNLFGVENSFSYTPPGARIFLNLTWQSVLHSRNYLVNDNRVDGIPAVTVNLVASKRVFDSSRHSLWVNADLSCYTRQSIHASAFRDGKFLEDDNYPIKGSALLGIGLCYRFLKLEHCLTCKNVFNTRYTRASSYNIDVPQQGRHLMWTVRYSF